MSDAPTPIWLKVAKSLGLTSMGHMGKWVGTAGVIGFAGGLAAVGFDWITHAFKERSLSDAGVVGEGLPGEFTWWLVLLIPALGGLIVGAMIHLWAPEASGHGTERLIGVFHNLNGKMRKRVVAIKAITSAITIGTGGSAGQEGPVAQIGGGVGSALSDALKLGDRDRRIFLLSGAAAGVGALFTAPLGGALFAPEVLYRKPEFEGEAIIPCIVSSIVAFTTFTFITGRSRAIDIAPEVLAGLSFHDPRELLVYFALAVLCAIVGWAYISFFGATHRFFNKLKIHPALKPALGGLALGVLVLAMAPLTGEHGILYGGYELMRSAIAGSLSLKILGLLLVGKILATSFSIASGGSGGVFAPSLAIGGLLGAIVGSAAQQMFPALEINPACFALVGMGGFFAGVAKTPIASIIMVCEMTGSYELLAPLMLVSVVHVLLAQRWTIYETQVDSPVDSPAHAGDFVVDVLERMNIKDVVDPDRVPPIVNANSTLRKALDIVSVSRGTYFPVVDDDENLIGIFSLSDIRRIFRETDIQDLVIVRDFMVENPGRVKMDDHLGEALRLLNEYSIHELPVVDPNNTNRVIAMLNRNNIGAAYHQRLRELKLGNL
ncbi:MAG: CIC family chloride channel protein [Planctomycetota bacterium]|jgi:CIC family chloride channel protein